MRTWWKEAWQIGLDNPTDRTFVAEDTENQNRIVGFSRWMVPQQDGNQERKWPDMSPSDWDMEIVENFFGGMEENRHEMMGTKPHWSINSSAHEELNSNNWIDSARATWCPRRLSKARCVANY